MGPAAIMSFDYAHPDDFYRDTVREIARDYGDITTRPEGSNGSNPHEAKTEAGRRVVHLTRASTIKPRPVCWLWLHRLALGTLALIGGREGIGKSILAYTLAADITRGRLWEAAHMRFFEDAKSLTDDDLAQFSVVDPAFAERARAKRAGFVAAKTEAEAAGERLPATRGELVGMFTDCVRPLLATYRYKMEETRDLIVALEARIAALERKPHLKFTGVYQPGRLYQPGDAATYQGGLWICKAATTGQPNQDFAGWQLAVKSRSIP
jgi:hypothetical protein